MRIGVLSDTHIPYAAKGLPEKALDILATVDVIIHAGDFQDISVIDKLTSIASFYGVSGNMDPPEIRSMLPEKRVLRLQGFTIGVIHGWGSPAGLEDRIFTAFDEYKIDAIVFGHSHNAVSHVNNNLLFFNPGSPTDNRFAKTNSIGILTLDKEITGEILKI